MNLTNNNIIAFDFGTHSMGIAIGQLITKTAQPLTSLKTRNKNLYWQQIEKILKEWHPYIIIIGLPINLNGKEQILTTKARKFANQLYNRFNIKTILHDERFSTVEAKNILFNINGYRALKKEKIDALSAALILESWIESSFL